MHEHDTADRAGEPPAIELARRAGEHRKLRKRLRHQEREQDHRATREAQARERVAEGHREHERERRDRDRDHHTEAKRLQEVTGEHAAPVLETEALWKKARGRPPLGQRPHAEARERADDDEARDGADGGAGDEARHRERRRT